MKEIKEFIQDHEIKCKHKFRHFEKEDIDKVADFKFIPNPANGV